MVKCFECKKPIFCAEDNAVWIDPKTGTATMLGEPYHVECAPEEKENVGNPRLYERSE